MVMRTRDAYNTPSPWFGLRQPRAKTKKATAKKKRKQPPKDQAARAVKRAAPAPEPEDTATLAEVPDDVAQHVLAHLNAYDVTRLALTGSIWRNHVRRFRRKLVRIEYTPNRREGWMDSVWVFEALGSTEQPLRVRAPTECWGKTQIETRPRVVETPSWPDDRDWLEGENDELPDDSWIALARAFPGAACVQWFPQTCSYVWPAASTTRRIACGMGPAVRCW